MISISHYVLILFVIFTVVANCHHNVELNSIKNEDVSVQTYFANLLKSLVKLNEQRVKTLRQLFLLDGIDFGKALRSSDIIDYDEVIKSIKSILALLSNKDNINYLIEHDNKHDLNTKKIARAESEDASSNENENKSDLNHSYGNNGHAKNNNINNKNGGHLRYMSCGEPLLRCISACYDTYSRACYKERCSLDFEIQMRFSCREACHNKFDNFNNIINEY